MLRFSDARNFGRTLTGLLLIAAPVMFLLSDVVQKDIDDDNKTKELANVAAHKSNYLLTNFLFLIGGLFLIGAGVGLIKMFRGPRGVTLGQVAGSMILFGSTVMLGWFSLGAAEYEMINIGGLDRATMARFLDKAQDASVFLPLMILFIVGLIIGLIVLGIAALRTRIVPVWAGVLLILAGPLLFLSDGGVMGVVSSLVTIAGLGSLGLAALQMSDEEWDAPLERRKPTAAPDTTVAPAPAT
jgi:hypothetical protein